MTAPYRKPVSKFLPGYTYEFEWSDTGLGASLYKGRFVRLNKLIERNLLFRDLEVIGHTKCFAAKDADLAGHSWINDFSSQGLMGVWEVAAPENNKAPLERGDWVANLFRSSLPVHGMEVCPDCGHCGKWIRTALICPTHGIFAGF